MAASFVSKIGRNLIKFNTSRLQKRGLHFTPCRMQEFDAQFQKAQEDLKELREDPGNETKLVIYALFKQSTVGKVNTSRPGMMDFVGRAKWDAWNKYSDLSQNDAKKKYIDLVAQLTSSQSPEIATNTTSAPAATLKIEIKDGISVITLNRPKKKNALSTQMYNELTDALNAAAVEPSTRITVVTGAGDYYCSGNDLGNFMIVDPAELAKTAKDGAVLLERFVSSFIDHPKPLVALVNGPAIGVAVTSLGLFDLVYASDRATFETPFTALGQSPEGCSSVTFPKLMGTGKACEVMLFGKKLSAQEAKACNLVTEVFPADVFHQEAWHLVEKYAKLPKDSMRLSKQLIRGVDKEMLHAANKRECELLIGRWQSDECIQAIMNFFQQKSKL